MDQSFYSAVSGLKTHQFGVDTWADNISNISTNAFKQKNPEFSTLFSDYLGTLNSNSANVNTKSFGTTISSNKMDFATGSIVNSDNPYDLAIADRGFFVLKNGDKTSYTRDGSFLKDADGYLVTSNGKRVQGIDLGKVNDNEFSIDNDKNELLASNDIETFSDIKIPSYLQFRSAVSTNASMSLNLNANDNLSLVEDSYGYVHNLYNKNITSIKDEDAKKFYNIKAGESLSMNIDNKEYKYTYGTDFTTIQDLQNKIKSEDSGFILKVGSSGLSLRNISSAPIDIDFSNSSNGIKRAFGLKNNIAIGNGENFAMSNITSSKVLGINFNALNTENGTVNIEQGDDISITIDGETHSLYYGKANETIVDGTVLGEEDTFLSIGDFVSKMEAKANIKVDLENNSLVFFSENTKKLQFSSTNNSLLHSLGLEEDYASLSGVNIFSSKLQVGTYSANQTLYDVSGDKYFVFTEYVLNSKNNDSLQQDESWHTSSYRTNKDGNIHSSNTKDAILRFEEEDSPPKIYVKQNNELIEKQSLELDFLDKHTVAYDIAGKNNASYTTNLLSTNSSIKDSKFDGNSYGELQNVIIDSQGLIRVKFSNDKEAIMGRVALVDFINLQGLQSTSNNEYITSYVRSAGNTSKPASGSPYVMWDQNGASRTRIFSNSIEKSNVNLSTGLTQLIVLQRAYSANSTVVTTSDEMTKEALGLKK